MATPDTLYHYCTTEAFHAIVDSRSVRLSSMSLSNDFQEGRLVSQTVESLAMRDGLTTAQRANIAQDIARYERSVDGLAFCLSEHGDLLSQWRGYAGNATGLSIGFSTQRLLELVDLHMQDATRDPPADDSFFINLHRARYSNEEHAEEVRPIYEQARFFVTGGTDERWAIPPELPEELRSRGVEQPDSLARALLYMFYKLFLLKSEAFRAEDEWRLISYSLRGVSDRTDFRPAGTKLVPYRSVNLSRIRGAITSVITGPKHETPVHVLRKFLHQSGFGPPVTVEQSRVSYR